MLGMQATEVNMPIRLMVHDVDAAVAFYRDLLGFALVRQYGPAMAMLTRGQDELWLAGPPSSAAKPMPDGRKPEPGGWNRLVVQVPDIAATASALRDVGATFRNDVISGPGGAQVLVEDPSGNPVELFQPAATAS
jgi:catechol 2,3-dioxygenase-like lactoylglutathione lyase family enzyme